MNKTKELLSNSIYFFIGNIGAKFFVFLLVPLYTSYLSKAEYGNADLVTNAINLIVPIFTIAVYEGVFRFVISGDAYKEVLHIGVVNITLSAVIVIIVGALVYLIFGNILEVLFIVIVQIILMGYRYLFSYYAKARGNNKLYVTDSVLYAMVLFGLSYLFICVLGMGIRGYFLAFIGATLFSVVMLIVGIKQDIIKIKYNKSLAKNICLYSLPIMINTIAQWVANFSDRVMLRVFVSDEATGIYAAASKIPAILTVVFSVFLQAWTISSIKDYEGEKDEGFYKKTFETYTFVCALIVAVSISFSNIVMKVYVGEEFQDSTCYVPLLIVNSVIVSYIGFFGAIYSAAKKSKSVALTTIYAAVLNVVLNILLIPRLDILGAIIATIVSHFIFWVYRIYDTRKWFAFSFNGVKVIIELGLVLIQSIIIMLCNDVTTLIFVNIAIVVCILVINRKCIGSIIDKIRKLCKRK